MEVTKLIFRKSNNLYKPNAQKMITLSIDVTQLDKTRLKRMVRKNGKEAVFCDLVMIDTPDGKYGDFIVKQSVTKEERQSKKEMPILGNGKNFAKGTPKSSPPESDASPQHQSDDDVPF
jgi:hypothetical protein